MSDFCSDVGWVADYIFFPIDDDCIPGDRFVKPNCGCEMVWVINKGYVKSAKISYEVRKKYRPIFAVAIWIVKTFFSKKCSVMSPNHIVIFIL